MSNASTDLSVTGISTHTLGEGKMGALIRSRDWSKTSLGPIESWPKSLQAHVSMILALPTPAAIYWGDAFIQIYNDGYSVIMGPRHPEHLGSAFRVCWPEAFPLIASRFERITKNTEVLIFNRFLTPLARHGFLEECYFTSTMSPIRDDDGNIRGVLSLGNEVSESMFSERRLEMLRKVSQGTILQADNFQSLMQILASNPNDIRFALLFLPDSSESQLKLVASTGINADLAKAPGFDKLMSYVRATFTSNLAHEINDLQTLTPHAPVEPWPELTENALALSICTTDSKVSKGVVVFGLSPRLKFDGKYREFFIDTAQKIAHALEADAQIRHAVKMHKSYEFVNSVIENVPLMIFVKDAKDLRFTHFNKAGEDLLGYNSNDLIGKNDYDFFNKKEADFFTEKDRATLAGGKILDIPEELIQTRLKGERILHTKKITLFDEKGEPEFLLGISEDITDKKQAEEQHKLLLQEQFARIEAEKMIQQRDDFISIAAHELRTPLTSISLQNQLISRFLPTLKGVPNLEKFIALTHNCQVQIERLTKLVENLLDVTRATTGRLVLDKTEFNLSGLIEQISKGLEVELNKTKCTLELQLEPSVIGKWDQARIEQILVNLLSNAMKFGQGKPIEISTKVEGSKAVLRVIDHGIGISKEDQIRLFNRFERAVSITSFGGLGLGLYISRQLATAHGGTILVESELGKGTTFIVELPL